MGKGDSAAAAAGGGGGGKNGTGEEGLWGKTGIPLKGSNGTAGK
jgi:hypothetical protein